MDNMQITTFLQTLKDIASELKEANRLNKEKLLLDKKNFKKNHINEQQPSKNNQS